MTEPSGFLQDASISRGATDGAPAPDPRLVRKGLAAIAALLSLFVVLGPLVVSRIGHPGVLNPGTGTNTFFEQYRRHEPVFLVLMAVFAIGVALLARRPSPDEPVMDVTWRGASRWNTAAVALTTLFVFAVTVLGSNAVMHALPLSMDEYIAQFQSRIFASGNTAATLPEAWQPFAGSLSPVYVVYDTVQHLWTTQYLPLYAALRAAFVGIGADRFVNPLLAALSVPLVFASARRAWPTDTTRAWLAVGFLVTSSQFVFMSMTGYSMPAHLAINLLWLYAFLRGDRAGWLAAPLIGVVALGLHNPFPHALFVTPFLVYVLMSRRWGWTIYFGAVYLAGIALWHFWGQTVQFGGQGPTGLFVFPGVLMFEVQQLSLTLMLSWQTPLLVVALLWTAAVWRSLSATERCLGAGVILSLTFFLFFPRTQGHGWGYRYTYPVLGNMALLGAVGVDRLARALGGMTVRRLVVASAALTVLAQWPVRAWQVEGYVRPFARAQAYIAGLDADIVIVDPTTSWYGIDLVRNDPFLHNTPKVLSAFYLRPEDKQALAARYGDRVHMLQPNEIGQFGIPTFPSRFKRPVWPPQ